MTSAARRIGALLAVTAAALAAYAITQTSDTGTSTRADSVWSVPADTPSPAPSTGTPIAAPRDSVW